MNSESYYSLKGPAMASFQHQHQPPQQQQQQIASESNYQQHGGYQLQPMLTSPPMPPIRNYAAVSDGMEMYTNLLGGSHVNYNGTYYNGGCGELIDLSASQLHQPQQQPQYHQQLNQSPQQQQQQHNDMYNADIDFMNNYLKSLPEYAAVACPSSMPAVAATSAAPSTAAVVAPHIKSENYRHHYVNDPYVQYYDSATAMQGYYPIVKSSSYHAAGGHPAAYYNQQPYQQQQVQQIQSQSYVQLPPHHHHHHHNQHQHHHNHHHQQPPVEVLPRSTSHTLIPRGSVENKYSANKIRSTPSDNTDATAPNVPYVPKQSSMSKFWQETTSNKPASGPKFGWNYDRIMAKTKKDVQNSINEYKKNVTSLHNLYSSADGSESHIPEANTHFKLRKNYSYSHLDKHIRDHLTEEEFQQLVNESESKPNFYSNHSCNYVNPLCKSYSSGTMGFSQPFLPPSRPLPPNQPPTSLAKSISNTSIQRKPSITMPDVAAFIPSLNLAKSSSSSCIYTKALNQPNSKKYNLFTPYKSIIPEPPGLSSLPPSDISATNKMISKNNALIKKSASFQPFTNNPTSRKGTSDNFFVKQHIPPASKVVVDYPAFTKISSIQIPINGHLPPAFLHNPRDLNNNNNQQDCIINIEDNIEQSIADIYNVGYDQPQIPQPQPAVLGVFKSYSHSRLNPDAKNFTPSRSLCAPSSTTNQPPVTSLARSNSNSCNVAISQSGQIEPLPTTTVFNSLVEVTPTYVPAKGITLSKSATQIASYGDDLDDEDTVVPCGSDEDDEDEDDDEFDLNYLDDEEDDGEREEDDPSDEGLYEHCLDQYFVPSSSSKSMSTAKVGECSQSMHTNTPALPKNPDLPKIFTSNADIFLETGADPGGTGLGPAAEEFLLDDVTEAELYAAFPASDSTDSCTPEPVECAAAEALEVPRALDTLSLAAFLCVREQPLFATVYCYVLWFCYNRMC